MVQSLIWSEYTSRVRRTTCRYCIPEHYEPVLPCLRPGQTRLPIYLSLVLTNASKTCMAHIPLISTEERSRLYGRYGVLIIDKSRWRLYEPSGLWGRFHQKLIVLSLHNDLWSGASSINLLTLHLYYTVGHLSTLRNNSQSAHMDRQLGTIALYDFMTIWTTCYVLLPFWPGDRSSSFYKKGIGFKATDSEVFHRQSLIWASQVPRLTCTSMWVGEPD